MRTMAAEGKEMYRVVIVRRRPRQNPELVRGEANTGKPYWLYDGEEFESAYGPYNAIGAARAILSRETLDAYGGLLLGVVGGRIEKAATAWTTVT
jgi:hypothetical protein